MKQPMFVLYDHLNNNFQATATCKESMDLMLDKCPNWNGIEIIPVGEASLFGNHTKDDVKAFAESSERVLTSAKCLKSALYSIESKENKSIHDYPALTVIYKAMLLAQRYAIPLAETMSHEDLEGGVIRFDDLSTLEIVVINKSAGNILLSST